jgi:hypothetical protein
MATFDIDQMKSDFQPVDIVFHGQEYVLGRNAVGLLDACELHAEIEDLDGMKYLKALLELLPRLALALCPDLVLDDDLDAGEQMALVKVCTEVLGRVTRLTFPAEEPEGEQA